MTPKTVVVAGNTAAAHIAYRTDEVCAIYPIAPSCPMAELADAWAAEGIRNIWGQIPVVQQMESEAGAAGALHGSLQGGALTTTFTASQGFLLMLPNMYKIAGELNSCVFHVAARAVATNALSIFGDHSDVMSARMTGFGLLAASSVQEAHDLALVARAATLEGRIPLIFFFDGFRTSHEENTVTLIPDEQIRAMIDDELVRAHRARALSPEHPVLRGTAHNPDTYFQAREAAHPFYEKMPGIVQKAMDRLATLTSRQYRLFRYSGHPEAERVVVAIGSAIEVLDETAAWLGANAGEKVGVLQVILYRPWDGDAFLAALPKTTKAIAVLDRTKESGSPGEPLYLDVLSTFAAAFSRGRIAAMPMVVGGRYGIASKDFDPAMAKAVFDELKKPQPRNGFTVGIEDDVSHTSLAVERGFDIESADSVRALFYGLGADGTVGANQNSTKILASEPGRYAQGYFVYDSKKSGSYTISHLRFGPKPIRAPYLLKAANFIGVHKFDFLFKFDALAPALPGATVLLNSPYNAAEVWDQLPREAQQQIVDRRLRLFVIDASKVAYSLGLGSRTNTILQTCFFALSGVLPRAQAIAAIKAETERTYARKGKEVVKKNFEAIDEALANLFEVKLPAKVTSTLRRRSLADGAVPAFVRDVVDPILTLRGDEVPVSAFPVDGTYPTGTTKYEKRNIAEQVPVWDPDLCIQCGQCSIVCPHSVIRAKTFAANGADGAPAEFKSAPINARGYPDSRYTLQIYVEDCTGCGVCVENCPSHSPVDAAIRAINMKPRLEQIEAGRKSIAHFEALPWADRSRVNFANVRGVQFLQPLFEFPGACAGCGEAPYLKLLSQLFGDRLQIANATGCSSIYGANLPTTPWTKNAQGRGPAWSNSLFEDNAEFGLGYRLAIDRQTELARSLARKLAPQLGEDLVRALLEAPQVTESDFEVQRRRVAELKAKLAAVSGDDAANLLALADFFVRRSVWCVGGDGWAYDIGYGGLDHVLASGQDINILVLDTEVYSNTGGQASKATPLGASAKFAAAGKRSPRKDLAMMAIAYGNVYVAQVAMGANSEHTLIAMREAEAHHGPSIVLAYSQCIAHGIDMRFGMKQAARATASGTWPLFRFDPGMRQRGMNPFRLDSPRPRIPLEEYRKNEVRFNALALTHPTEARHMLSQAQLALEEKYRNYEDLAARDGSRFLPHWEDI
ncbi:MAG: pyruvate:ferredoxin (flavodoxin) oxidoreductase [Alphaproteobacteria bacterium]|nr:pyruvate:ferredoxin (flavodoxin) oxidoreductase [Alphaproteobacteria bacterium]MBV8407948.1 pyruvate:ferredoxin (flavodoxin) oxidoreductase [Alphaproteobacteria bacterium]